MRKLYRAGKFYTRIIMKNIGIFVFIGLLSVVFNDHGWLPNENMYAISQLVYIVILPALIAYEGGKQIGGTQGGVLAVLAVSGVLAASQEIGLSGALLLAPGAGFFWKIADKTLTEHVKADFQMLVRNLVMGAAGGALAAVGFFWVAPALNAAALIVYGGVDFLISHGMLGVLSIVIEPAKVFFLNNLMNHAILVPLGMGQVQAVGSSVLFLLETNPGPGMGILMAMGCAEKRRRSECGAALFAQAAGGIHEVYFPYVMSDLKLLFPLILGGMAGNFCFSFFHAGLKSAVSPGSLFIIWLMAEPKSRLAVIAGIGVSAAVSFAGSMVILKKYPKNAEDKSEGDNLHMLNQSKVTKIAFMCDGGMGSSVMAASLFRRELAKGGITGIEVKAFAADLVPEDAQLLVCQKDFYRQLPKKLLEREIFTVENLVSIQEYETLIAQIRRRNE